MTCRRGLSLSALLLCAGVGGLGATAPLLHAQEATTRESPESAVPETPAQVARRLAEAYQLTNADGDRICHLTLAGKAVRPPAGVGHPLFALSLDRAACAEQIAFAADIASWSPGPGDAIRLHAPSGRLVAEFTEGAGGAWEALRERDGVYFLINPRLAQAAPTARPADLFGLWRLSRAPDAPFCTVMFGEQPFGDGDYPLAPDAACAALFGTVSPERWRLEAGDLLLLGDKGEPLRFAAQEDGSWLKVPEDRATLMLSRSP
ncbi:AprI/Inh family metalloprotease inhibitor [Ancylobacter oerskovii]|uniref:AprI/Inh family metalloprotease inhibitor n=1 Tax=Ancylobacter oerskovii TaxID=459519 RepID=A0ABW4YS34_9HYPH|nr:AprI/Inh family metalloprotease inhibitor [Ancylobacter oerskovii]MBS7545327.1 AprI/Inh family metalloprotease inhibitor [Ancylobacter oerskovii]